MLYYTEAFTTNVTFVWPLTCVVRVGFTVARLVVPLTTVFIYLRMRFHISVATNGRSEEHTSELQSLVNLVCRLLLEKNKNKKTKN